MIEGYIGHIGHLWLMHGDGGLYRVYRSFMVLRFIYGDGGLYMAYRVLRLIYSDGGLYRAFRMLRLMYSDGGHLGCRGSCTVIEHIGHIGCLGS